MSKNISIIGLGDMGGVLAATLLKGGYHITVWNRSAEKAAALVKQGAVLAPSAAEAVKASPIVIICVSNYNISRNILSAAEVAPLLQGRVLIELSTGTPKDARDSEEWAKAQGAEYLDGAIIAVPDQIGRPDTPIFVSGATAVFKKSEAPLKVLAGGLQFMGEDAGAAAAWDLGFLAVLFGAITGFLQGARVFQTEGIPVAALADMVAVVSPLMGEMIKHEGYVIESGDYSNPQSSIAMSSISMILLKKHAEETGINAEIPTFIKSIFDRAIAAGYGNEQVGAMIKVLN